jgi:hypothetical protein
MRASRLNVAGVAGIPAVLVLLAACSSPGASIPTITNPIPTGALPTSLPSVDIRTLAEEACLATQFPNCVDDLVQMAQTAPGSLVAICDHGNDTGKIVVVESEAAAEAECTNDGTISGARVVGVLQLP